MKSFQAGLHQIPGAPTSFDDFKAFSPLLVQNTILWYDASDNNTVWTTTGMSTKGTNGASIARWNDKSGNAHDAEAISSTKPVYSTNILNGKPGMLFDTNDNTSYFDTILGSLPTADPLTFAIVLKIVGNIGLTRSFIGAGVSNNQFVAYCDAAAKFSMNRQGVEVLLTSTVAVTINTPTLLIGTFDHTTGIATGRINGSANGNSLGHTTAINQAFTRIGADQAPSGAKCYVFEMLYWNKVLTANQLSYIEKGLSKKWALGF